MSWRDSIYVLLLVPLAAGCEVLAGIEERSYEPRDGGEGGQAGPYAADWTQALAAVYTFELPSPELGNDSSGSELHLTEHDGPEQSTEAQEGRHSLSINRAQFSRLESTAGALGSNGPTGFTVGAWLKPVDVNENGASLVGRTDTNTSAGYLLTFEHAQGRGKCTFVGASYESPAFDGWPLGDWLHLVCRYDADQHTVTPVGNGNLGLPANNASLEHTGTFGIPSSSYSASTALVDEVFVAHESLSVPSIRRIWACTVRGDRCTCKADDPPGYEDCGRAMPGCIDLAPCDQPTP